LKNAAEIIALLAQRLLREVAQIEPYGDAEDKHQQDDRSDRERQHHACWFSASSPQSVDIRPPAVGVLVTSAFVIAASPSSDRVAPSSAHAEHAFAQAAPLAATARKS